MFVKVLTSFGRTLPSGVGVSRHRDHIESEIIFSKIRSRTNRHTSVHTLSDSRRLILWDTVVLSFFFFPLRVDRNGLLFFRTLVYLYLVSSLSFPVFVSNLTKVKPSRLSLRSVSRSSVTGTLRSLTWVSTPFYQVLFRCQPCLPRHLI